MEVVDGMIAGQSQGIGRMSEMPVHFLSARWWLPITSPSRKTALGRVESDPGMPVARYPMRRLRFVVHAASWLQSMVLHGCSITATTTINKYYLLFFISCFVFYFLFIFLFFIISLIIFIKIITNNFYCHIIYIANTMIILIAEGVVTVLMVVATSGRLR